MFLPACMLKGNKIFTDLSNSLSHIKSYFHCQQQFKVNTAPTCACSRPLLGLICVTLTDFTLLFFASHVKHNISLKKKWFAIKTWTQYFWISLLNSNVSISTLTLKTSCFVASWEHNFHLTSLWKQLFPPILNVLKKNKSINNCSTRFIQSTGFKDSCGLNIVNSTKHESIEM